MPADTPRSAAPRRSVFTSVPAPVRKLFDQFPIHTYPSNALPATDVGIDPHTPSLHLSITPADAAAGRASHDPVDLAYQTYLLLHTAHFLLVPTSTATLPPGALPYLATPSPPRDLLRRTKLLQFANPSYEDPPDLALLYTLVSTALRAAYLAALLHPPTFGAVAAPRYINWTTSNPLVRLARALQLQSAARSEVAHLVGASTFAGARWEVLLEKAERALAAVAASLDGQEWVAGEKPGWIDAVVFGYTHCIFKVLGEAKAESPARQLREVAGRYPVLRAHADRVRRLCFA